ncbi:MAG: GNAT family N-acetyltransferase [Pseudomonadota bacterium]
MISYRRAQLSDAAIVREIRLAAANELKRLHGEGHWSAVFTLGTLKKHVLAKEVFLVNDDENPVGTFEIQTNKPNWYSKNWFAEPDARTFYLFHMAVLPVYQMRGIGRHILGEIDNMARGRGIRAVRLDAYAASAGAGAFYSKYGYELVRRGSFNGVSLDYYEKYVNN